MTDKHKVFLSYHHALDQFYKDEFLRLFSSIVVDWSVRDGDIDENLQTETIRQKIRDEFLRDSTVTIVLVGAKTWGRKHVDWEIGSSLRHTQANPRSGLLGVLLPTYPTATGHDLETVPPRLEANLRGADPYAKVHRWTTDTSSMKRYIHDAFLRRSRQPDPDNGLPSFAKNRT